MTLPNILIVDDEQQLTTPLYRVLSNEDYDVEVANDGLKAIELVNQKDYDLLILDWMLPFVSGIEICSQLRSQGKTTPVLFLTAKDTIDDRVLGLDTGADDYLVKPFELRELLARVRALLRRAPNFPHSSTNKLKFEDLELDLDHQLAYRGDRIIKLSEKETKLLAYFMSNKAQLLTHEEIYQYLWQDEEKPNSNVLAAFIRLLRRKISLSGEIRLIHSLYGKGYFFGRRNN